MAQAVGHQHDPNCGTSGPLLLLSSSKHLRWEVEVMSKARWDEHAFWRKLVLPQEERSALWEGKGYRWFRSPNVIPIEQWRQHKRGEEEPGAPGGSRRAVAPV